MKTWSIHTITKNLKEKKVSSTEVVSYFLKRIEKLDSHLNSIITINPQSFEEAKKVDQKGSFSKPLEGVPILLKDMFCTKGLKTTAGSKMLENFIPPYSSEVSKRLTEAGAIILGKCNQDEFAMGNSNQTSYFGPVKNPWNLKHIPGGSSGGSAASVSAGLSPLSIGTDTGGSVRQPSHFCNLSGLKPTYGRISRYGIISYASSLDQAGPMTSRIEDLALVLNIISGKDPKDLTTSSQKVPLWHKHLTYNIKGLKVGWPQKLVEKVSPVIQQSLEKGRKILQKNGASIQPVSFSLASYFANTYYLISSSEASSNLSRYDGIRYGHKTPLSHLNLKDFYSETRAEGFGSEVKRRILMGTFCLSQGYYEAYFEKAQKIRRLVQREFQEIFKEVDVILLPVTPDPPALLGSSFKDDLKDYSGDIFTVPANLTGFPSLNAPMDIHEGLPSSVQIMGKPFDEQTILNTAYLFQKELKMYEKRPPIFFEES